MTIQEVWDNAREVMAPNCRACKVCDGKACRGEIPGVGGMGDSSSWTACMDFLKSVKLNMDTVYDYHGTDTALSMFGNSYDYPVFIAPIGGMGGFNYNSAMTLGEYSQTMAEGALDAGILSFVGGNDAMGGKQFEAGLRVTRDMGGRCVVTVKPYANELMLPCFRALEAAGAVAVASDIDAAGFANMRERANSVNPKGVAELRELAESVKIPFVLKGIMTAAGAVKAAEAGCYAIIVSTHGGRVITSAPSTCEVLPEIRAAVGDRLKIIVDGGIRSGTDIFKAIALGADAVMIGRPYAVAVYGGGREGVALYTRKLGEELRHTMLLCGASSLAEISPKMLRLPK
ncbi:MAG: alpha-hydroxy-acid oxidizing protein [Oscillospiraceae bacterium]